MDLIEATAADLTQSLMWRLVHACLKEGRKLTHPLHASSMRCSMYWNPATSRLHAVSYLDDKVCSLQQRFAELLFLQDTSGIGNNQRSCQDGEKKHLFWSINRQITMNFMVATSTFEAFLNKGKFAIAENSS